MQSIKEIFKKIEEKISKNPSNFNKVGGVVKFDISGPQGGNWFVDLRKGSTRVTREEIEPSCTFASSDNDFLKLINKELKPERALLTGKVRLSGDIALAMRLANLFK